MANQNLDLLIIAAKLLRPVLDDLVFAGGCATGLLVSDEGAAEVRPTFDVDAIAEILSTLSTQRSANFVTNLASPETQARALLFAGGKWSDQIGSHAFG